MNSRFIIMYISLLVGAFSSCSKSDMYDEKVAEKWHQDIVAFQRNGVTVDKVKNGDDAITFSFSDGGEKGFPYKRVPAITIDARGFWRIGNKLTDKGLEEWGTDRMILANAGDGEFAGIIEDYTAWSFYFSDGSSVTLKKTLFTYDPDERMRGINHRGYNRSAPENTLPAYRLSRLMGFRYVETDIRFSSDGVPVLLHDATVNRTSDGDGAVADFTWEELQAMDFGAKSQDYRGTKIPNLDDFLALCSDLGMMPYLELKTGTDEQIGQIVQMVEEYGLTENTVYISFYDYLLAAVSKFNPTATLGLLVKKVDYDTAIAPALALCTVADKLFIDSSDYGEEAVKLCRDAGLPLEVWTVDSSSDVKSLSDYVSGVTSNQLHAGRVLLGRD